MNSAMNKSKTLHSLLAAGIALGAALSCESDPSVATTVYPYTYYPYYYYPHSYWPQNSPQWPEPKGLPG